MLIIEGGVVLGEHTASSYVRKIFLVNISIIVTKELLLF